MNRRFRLVKSADFKRVRRNGKSYAHPFIVLIAHPNHTDQLRIAVVAGRSVGSAVRRNRAKRLMRAVLQQRLKTIRPGWDIILIARQSMANADYETTDQAIDNLINRANLLLNDCTRY